MKDYSNYQKPLESELREKLTPEQYKATQQNGTEPPFNNAYWDNHNEGLYVDVVSGEPLFSSEDKFDSGTGWPSFRKPINEDAIETRKEPDGRTEVHSKHAKSHLGHFFMDSPYPTGPRYCMNSVALRFIKKEDLEKEGYDEYSKSFE